MDCDSNNEAKGKKRKSDRRFKKCPEHMSEYTRAWPFYDRITVMKQASYTYGCAICGKGVQHSNLVSFSKRRIKHVRKPNLHVHHLKVEGSKLKIKVCTTCKRSIRITEREAQASAQKLNA